MHTFIISLGLIFILLKPVWAQSDFAAFFNSAEQYQNVVVEKVLSVDTIMIKGNEKVKLIGLIAPELPHRFKKERDRDQYGFRIEKPVSPIISIEQRAIEYVEGLLFKKHIRLEFDVERINDNFRTLAYIFLKEDDTFVNAEIIRQGFANLSIRPPNTKYSKELRTAYQEAKQEKRGLRGE